MLKLLGKEIEKEARLVNTKKEQNFIIKDHMYRKKEGNIILNIEKKI